jgi:solute:Na+ symporter, SSS family
MLSIGSMVGAGVVLALITYVGMAARSRVRSFDDFSTAGRSLGATYVAGTIIGTIVGGAATVGAAQLAYQYGLAGWWFSLGSCFALAFLGLFLSGPMRRAGVKTIPEYLMSVYGGSVGVSSWLFTSIGLLLNVIAQVLSATSLLMTMFGTRPQVAAIITFLAVVFYVIYGGVWSAGSVGSMKTALLMGSMLVVGFATSVLTGGGSTLRQALPAFPYWSLFGRGLWVDLAAAFSLLVGVSSTQTYLQAVFSAKDERASRNGTLMAAAIAPVLGLPPVLVGMYMKTAHPGITPASALPLFITTYLSPVMSGAILATLFISVIGTAAGLSLGVGVMFGNDIFRKRFKKDATDGQVLVASRMAITLVVLVSLVIALFGLDSLILKWSFLSMGLRGSTVFFPLVAAVFVRARTSRRAGAMAVWLAPALSLLWGVLNPKGMDPLYIGLATSVVTLVIGSLLNNRNGQEGAN